MDPLSFAERSERYDDIAMTLLDDPESLSTVDYGVQFTARSSAWRNGDIKNYTTTFFPIDDTLASNTDIPQEFVVTIIGEIAAEGSELGACGNAWLRPKDKITDKTTVKDVLVLTVPTASTPSLAILYDNQVRTLEGIYDKAVLPVPKADKVTHCTAQSDNGSSTITVVFPLKYRNPDDEFHTARPKLKRTLEGSQPNGGTARPDPEIGGLYELSVLSDFDSRLFDPKNTTRLAQRELLGKDGKLIGPWDMPAALRPGTLVAVEANFIVYSFCKKTDPGTVFQIQGQRIRILEDSPLPIPTIDTFTRPLLSSSPKRKGPSRLFSLISAPSNVGSIAGGSNGSVSEQQLVPPPPGPIAESSDVIATRSQSSGRPNKRTAALKNQTK